MNRQSKNINISEEQVNQSDGVFASLIGTDQPAFSRLEIELEALVCIELEI